MVKYKMGEFIYYIIIYKIIYQYNKSSPATQMLRNKQL